MLLNDKYAYVAVALMALVHDVVDVLQRSTMRKIKKQRLPVV